MNTRKRTLSLLLVLAMLIVALATILPATVSADVNSALDGEIDNYRYQTLIGANVKTSEDTDLRFLFSIDNAKLDDYTAVGFVFSKSDDPVKVDSPKENYKSVTTVYSTVTANGVPIPAPEGRYWVAIQLSDIPHASFATEIYVRPFVEDGTGTRYGETTSINVCEALGHTHEVSLLCTHCDGCNLDVEPQPTVLEINSTKDDNYVVKSSYEEEILGADKHFYPTSDNATGDDLFIEFSILWNHTLPDNCTGVMKTGNCGSNFKSNNVSTTWMSICDNYSDSWCPYAGGFEACDIGNVEFGYPNMGTQNAAYAEYPNIGGADQNNPEYGWHRVTIQLHQEVTNETALKADGTAGATQALYKLTGTYYFDGVKVATLSYSGDGKSNGGYWQASGKTKMGKGLFTAESDGEGGITYTDCYDNDAPYAYIAVVGKATAAENPGYVVLCDVSFTCGKAPVQDVQRVNAPVGDQTYTITEGVVVPANAYYKLAD